MESTEVALILPTIIGRGHSAQITIPHALVSRQHCKIEDVQGQLVVRDLGSLNGTYVGDEQITEAPLPPGALLTVGTVTYRAVYESAGQDSEGSLANQQLLSDRSCESTVNGIAAVEDDTARLGAEELPADLLRPAGLPPAEEKDVAASSVKPE